jgi:alkanesulfonate monooxygenase SsuD/methylene tetrahydromethanopterin reductase-like flavin-dependent oxidoreductase (luciferase family)
VVDILSNGRFIFGPAVGYRLEEFATFNIDRKFRGSITEEAIEVMRKCWTEDEFSFHGKHFQYDNVRCTPKPVQRPIPVWLGATQGEALRRAARIGDGLLGGGPSRAEYLTALAEYGKDTARPRIASTGRWLYCSKDPERDWQRLRPHALYQLQNYATWFRAAGQPAFGDPPVDYDDLESRGLYLCGTPDQIIEHITELYESFPFERHFYWAAWPGMDIETSSRGVKLFADEVIPALRHLGE